MSNPHRYVIDSNKIYVDLVRIDVEGIPQWYTLKKGESLVEAPHPAGILKPQWNGTSWDETATPEEIETAKPKETPSVPSETEILMVAVAEVYEKQLEQEGEILTTQLAVAELYETKATIAVNKSCKRKGCEKMTNPHRCVIDSKKMYVTFVLVVILDGKETPQHYTLKSGETLIEAAPPTGFKPQWTGKEWKELATPAEIEAAEKAQYESMGLPWPPVPPEPSEIEYLTESILDLDFRMTMQELGL